jgi:hypothetical protein
MVGFIAGMIACGIVGIIVGDCNEECGELERQIGELNEQIKRDRKELEKYL